MTDSTAPYQQQTTTTGGEGGGVVEGQPLVGGGNATREPQEEQRVPAWVPSFAQGTARSLLGAIVVARQNPKMHTGLSVSAAGGALFVWVLFVVSLAMERWMTAVDEGDIWISLRGSCAGTNCARVGEVCAMLMHPEECAVLRAGVAMQVFSAFGLIAILAGAVVHALAWHRGVVRGDRSGGVLASSASTWALLAGWLLCLLGLIIWAAVAAKFKAAVGSFEWGSAYGLNVFATIIGVVPIFLSVV